VSDERAFITRVVGDPHSGRFASLEGYRGVAALMVVVYHVRGAIINRSPSARADVIDNFGNFGVAVFFLLSGFLLFRPVSDAMLRRQPPAPVGRFLLRRFLRIYPGYWLAIVGWAFFATAEARGDTAPVKAFFLLSTDLTGLGVAWTLAIEVRFYCFLGVVAWIGPRVAARLGSIRSVIRLQVAFLVVMYAAAVAFRVYIVERSDGRFLYGGSMLNYLDWFALGMTLAVLVAWRDSGGRIWAPLASLASHEWACFLCSALCYAAVVRSMVNPFSLSVNEADTAYFFRFAVQGPGAFFLLLPAVLGSADQTVQRGLRRPWPAAVGTVSYGIYLWHKTIVDEVAPHLTKDNAWSTAAFGLVIVVVVSFVVSTVSYRCFERPALALADSPRRPPSRVEAAVG
jgi:peptidoglycan/LPS O-acetylase OafA/YrhL